MHFTQAVDCSLVVLELLHMVFNGIARTLENVTHIKGRLLLQAVILFNCVPFHNGNFSKRKEFAPRGSKYFPFRAVPYGMEINFATLGDLP